MLLRANMRLFYSLISLNGFRSKGTKKNWHLQILLIIIYISKRVFHKCKNYFATWIWIYQKTKKK